MPGFLLNAASLVTCMHGGKAAPGAPVPRVQVAGQPVVTQAAPWTVAGCPFMTGTNPMPCVTAQWTLAATRVMAGGAPVLLQDSQAVCVPNGTGVLVSATQPRVRGA
ncbi:MAG TPA: hypothetical protein VFQ45_08790 [Longimicrobium sp.]|nr:hypothetical protein [Longimicrobium sp.]